MQFGFTSLVTASKQGHVEVVHALLAAGADKEAQDYVGGGVTGGVGAGCRVHARLSSNLCCRVQIDFTPLIAASSAGHLEVVQALLAAGADREAKDKVRGGGHWATGG